MSPWSCGTPPGCCSRCPPGYCLCWMGLGDHIKTFLLKALWCKTAPSWLKVVGWVEQSGMLVWAVAGYVSGPWDLTVISWDWGCNIASLGSLHNYEGLCRGIIQNKELVLLLLWISFFIFWLLILISKQAPTEHGSKWMLSKCLLAYLFACLLNCLPTCLFA